MQVFYGPPKVTFLIIGLLRITVCVESTMSLSVAGPNFRAETLRYEFISLHINEEESSLIFC